MNTVNDSNTFDPARYAAQLAQSIDSLHRHLEAEQPEWWQQVLIELHDQLAEIYLADVKSGGRYKTQLENRAALMAMPKAATATGAPWHCQPTPWKCGNPKPPTTSDILLDTVHEQECHKHRLNALEEHLEAIAWWAGISFFHDESGKLFIPNGLQARLKSLESRADMQKTIDRLTAHLESLSAAHESLHNTCWKQSYDVGSRLDALESKTPR